MARLLIVTLLLGSTVAWIPQQQASRVAPSTRRTTQTPVQTPSSSSSLCMVSNLLGGSDADKLPKLPRDVKNAVSQCRQAVQDALKAQNSRMDIEFPVGTKFGVEKGGPKGKKSKDDDMPSQDTLDQSDRELARLFVEMFQPVGGDNIAVVFNEARSADLAKKRWKGDASATCRVLSVDRKKAPKSKKKKMNRGFAAKMAAEVEDSQDESGPFKLPDGTEVALFVAPGPKELIMVERVCDEAGMGTLVILLNARLSGVSNFGTDAADDLFLQDFKPVFNLSAGPQEAAPGCLLYRAYPGDWVLARKPRVGQPKTILVQSDRPSFTQCKTAFDALELTDMEQGVENVLENVAGWFR